MSRERVVIVQLARFGDVIQTSPLVRNLAREKGSSREITLVTDIRSTAAARLLSDVDRVVGIDLAEGMAIVGKGDVGSFKRFRRWVKSSFRDEQADRLILLNHGPLTTALASLWPAQVKTGPFTGQPLPPPHRYLVSALEAGGKSALHLCEIWAAYGPRLWPLPIPRIRSNEPRPALRKLLDRALDGSAREKRFALNLGAGAKDRIGSNALFGGIVRELFRRGAARVLLLGMERDRERAAKIAEKMSGSMRDGLVNLCGKTMIRDLPHVINECAVLISSDTGTLQLAAATSTQPIGLFFGRENPVETGAFKPGAIALTLADPITGINRTGNNFRAEAVAEIAWKTAAGEDPGKDFTDGLEFSLLLARSAPVAPEYAPLGIGGALETALRRRRAEARACVWGWNRAGGLPFGDESREDQIIDTDADLSEMSFMTRGGRTTPADHTCEADIRSS